MKKVAKKLLILEHSGIKRYKFKYLCLNCWANESISVFLLQFAKYNTSGELVELKNNEIEELTNLCGKCYEEQQPQFEKRKYFSMAPREMIH